MDATSTRLLDEHHCVRARADAVGELDVLGEDPMRRGSFWRPARLEDRGGRIAGYAFLVPFWSNGVGGEVCEVDELYVRPDQRGQGLGSALFEAIDAGHFGAFAATALGVTSGNSRARQLCERWGSGLLERRCCAGTKAHEQPDASSNGGCWSGSTAPNPKWSVTREPGILTSRTMAAVGKVSSVNVGVPREFDFNGRVARSAIWKSPVSGRIEARGVNLAGDDQADRKAHGGPDKAVYAYALEDLRWWERELGVTLSLGHFGENLTTEGIAVNDALVGERWGVGTAVLEVSEPRVPCWRLGVRMNDARFPRRFIQALRPGSYLRIVREGEIGAGDDIDVISRPDHDVTIRDVLRIFALDHDAAARLLTVPQLSDSWKTWARELMIRQSRPRSGSS